MDFEETHLSYDVTALDAIRFFKAYDSWYNSKAPFNQFKVSTKMGEEFGEVCEALFALTGTQKKIDKLEAKGISPEDALLEETGDLIITILNLLRASGLSIGDMFSSVANKMEKKVKEAVDACQQKKK